MERAYLQTAEWQQRLALQADNFKLYDVPRKEFNYKTPGMQAYKAQIHEYVEEISEVILEKREGRRYKDKIITRQELAAHKAKAKCQFSLSQINDDDLIDQLELVEAISEVTESS